MELRAAREVSGKTQAQVAKEVGISEISYQRIEYDTQTPRLSTAILIAKAVNSTVEAIFPIPQRQLRENTKQPDGNQA